MSYKYADDLESIEFYDALPEFNDLIYDYLYSSEIGITENSVLADIGSGTGRLSLGLLKKGSTVYAVDPDDNMRLICENKCKNFGSKFISINGNDINSNLLANSTDYLLVSQAFHRFNVDKFKNESNRILKNSNNVIIIWYRLDFSKGIFKDMLEALKKNFAEYESRYSTDEVTGALEEEVANNESVYEFFDGNTKMKTLKSIAKLNKDEFMNLGLSLVLFPLSHKFSSVIKLYAMDSFDLDAFKKALNDIFDHYSKDDYVILEFRVQVHSYCKNY